MKTRPAPSHRVAATLLLGILCLACCPAWPPNADGVRIASQEVLVVWDSEQNIEHFVRRADFLNGSSSRDFGFLVPTPSQPKLSETPDQVFYRLSDAIKPEIQYVTRRRPAFVPLLAVPFLIGGCSKDASEPMDKAEAVEVLDRAFVGGYEAAVLRADETDSLLAWLEENGYDARPELKDWLQPYIEKQWIITAFKYDSSSAGRSLSTAAVCMSFATESPFFPYRVPTDQLVAPEDGSLLRLYFAGDQRVAGTFEDGGTSWTASTKFSAAVVDAANMLAGVGGEGQAGGLSGTTWLTAFEDNTWPGGTEDLYFSNSADAAPVIPPPIIRERKAYVWIPPDVVLGTIALVMFLRRRRKRGAQA